MKTDRYIAFIKRLDPKSVLPDRCQILRLMNKRPVPSPQWPPGYGVDPPRNGRARQKWGMSAER